MSLSLSFVINFLLRPEHLRADLQDEAQAQIERITSEKELWENKYEQKRRALKDIELSLSKANADLEGRLTQAERQAADRLKDAEARA